MKNVSYAKYFELIWQWVLCIIIFIFKPENIRIHRENVNIVGKYWMTPSIP